MVLHLLQSMPAEVDEVIIAANYMIEALEKFFSARAQPPTVEVIDEGEPRGTGGALKNLEGMLREEFLVYNGDIVSDLDAGALVGLHRRQGGMGVIALHRVDDPTAFGMVELDASGRILRFVEKPKQREITSNLVNAGVYCLRREALEAVPTEGQVSLEREVFPALLPKGLYGLPFEGFWSDAGTLENYLKANHHVLEARGTTVDETSRVAPEVGLVDPVALGRGTSVEGGILGPFACVGDRCALGRARISNAVLFDRVVVEDGAIVEGSILGEGCVVQSDARLEGTIVGDGHLVPKGSKLIEERVGL
jgi:mannose-1-phosphate guanylyltransferase